MSVRVARVRDASAVGLVHVRSWQATYRGHFPPEFLDTLDPKRRAARWRTFLRENDARSRLLVSERDGHVVGFANVGPSRDAELPGWGEVRAMYVLPEYWGAGLGRELMIAGIEVLTGAGFRAAMLWVLEGNQRARRFYEAGGWRADGTRKEDDSFGFPIREVRYRRALP